MAPKNYQYDFGGYVTRYDVKCGDGRTIRKGAFKDCDGVEVPMVWAHQHDDPENTLGHILLECRGDGVYGWGKFNNTERGQLCKELVGSRDLTKLSIYANRLTQTKAHEVLHGMIREVSLVYAGANDGAYIDEISFAHEDDETSEFEAEIYTQGGIEEVLAHKDNSNKEDDNMADEKETQDQSTGEKKTVKDILDAMSEEEREVVIWLMAEAAKEATSKKADDDEDVEHSDINEGDDNSMHYNVFEGAREPENNARTLSHDEIQSIFADAKRIGNLRDAVLAHDGDGDDPIVVTYGIENVGDLFPDAKAVPGGAPEFLARNMDWVSEFMNGTHHLPFSRIKTMYADITADQARAKGYVKGHQKVNEVIKALKRTTDPTTIYKKQKLDRDDVIDITDFDVVAWIKREMRMMLDEEIARAGLIGDGRDAATDNDKIDETKIRPIWTDDEAYAIHRVVTVADDEPEDIAKALIKTAKSRKDYKGSGNPIFFTTEDMLDEMLMIEDLNGRVIYDTVDKLATALRVRKIVSVPVMDNQTREVSGVTRTLAGIIVNPDDYAMGADKGGSVNMFDDFNIDYNALQYLIETRCSGALRKPKSAIVLELVKQDAASDDTH